jgi:Protein of unknown function (DUF1064)
MYIQSYKNKYNAKKTVFNGIRYDSKFEASVAADLELRKKAGDIIKIERQVPLELRIYGKLWRTWKIDFVVTLADGSREFLEAKGMILPDFKMKFDFFEIVFDKDFRQHPNDKILIIKQGTNWDWLKKKKK